VLSEISPPRREGEGVAPKSTGGPADQLGVPLLVSLGNPNRSPYPVVRNLMIESKERPPERPKWRLSE